jgi:hypothetical protein
VIRCSLAVCAQQAIIDKQSNSLSLISVLDELTVPILPSLIGSLTAVFILHREAEDASQQQMTVTAGMTQFPRQSFPFSMDFQDKLASRGVATMGGIPITATGVFRVDLSLDDRVLGAWDIIINSVVQQPIISSGPAATEIPARAS